MQLLPLRHLWKQTQIHQPTQHNLLAHQTHGMPSSPKSRPPLNRYDKRHSNEKLNTKQNYTNFTKTWQTPMLNNKLNKPQISNGA